MVSDINWLEPWDSLSAAPNYFEKNFYREVGEQHVLFQVHDSEINFAVVHLTYSYKREKESKYPRTIVYKDLNHWINVRMIPDHSEYTLDEE